MPKTKSPTHTYVAVCNKTNFDGHYCKKFSVPEEFRGYEPGWYFLNRLDMVACLEMVMTWEDYSQLKDTAVHEQSLR